MMQHYPSGSSSHMIPSTLDSSHSFPRDLTCHTRNAEEWNDFHEKSGIRDKGKREFSHKEFGNKKHDKVTEERHLEGPSARADQWRQQEYYESKKPNGSARVLRNEHALKEHKEDVSSDGTSKRRVYSHSSTVHVSSHVTTRNNGKAEDHLTDFASFESPLPLDHSPQKGKGSLGKQGALNQRRRPSKGSLKVNVSSEEDFTDNNDNGFSSNPRDEFSSEVQRQNVENSRRSHFVNHQSSHIASTTTTTKSPKHASSVPKESPEWLKELKERKSKSFHESPPVADHSPSSVDGSERNPRNPRHHQSSSTYRRDNNTVLVVNSGTWTKEKKHERLTKETSANPRDHMGKNVKPTYSREVLFGDSDGEEGHVLSQSFDRRAPKSRTPSNPNSVILVEGPTTKLVTSFSHQTKSTKTSERETFSSPHQKFGTYDKKDSTQTPTSGLITINGDHPPTYMSKNQQQSSTSSPRSTHQLEKTKVEVTKREVSSRREAINSQDLSSQQKKTFEKTSEPGDNRAIIMNEIRKFDPRNLRKQMALHRTNLWVSRSTEDDDRYGYSQSEIVFDDDRDSGGWSPRVLSPSTYRTGSPRAMSPDIHRTYSEPTLKPPWVQVANEKQQKFYDWESIEERHKLDSSAEVPWQEESIRKSESIRNLMMEQTKHTRGIT